ncbi:MAG: Asp23/Gls24 family envelope stress response protein [Erysipelotrichaceae bacterium]|nr:Asp23/Gls24 family envelope stress response protein [Erysipelotrichaceae bacterium]MBR5755164.1 Asp23/Gls24 family envelope stress response protein [Erysipelotrichaceae bacterium]
MPVNKKTTKGDIKISDNAIATLAGTTVNECYGIVGVVSKNYLKDGYSALLKKENYSKGVVTKNTKDGLQVDVYVIVIYGVKISEVVHGLQQRVKYVLEETLNMDVNQVNVHVEGIKVNG